jgi:hypothetical protein
MSDQNLLNESASFSKPLTENDIRALLNAWSKKRIFRLRNIGDKIHIESITEHVAYYCELTSQFEGRRVTSKTESYSPYFSRPSIKVSSSIWEVPVPVPNQFENTSYSFVIDESVQIKNCDRFGCSNGKINCNSCSGSGMIICTGCGGSGSYTTTKVTWIGSERKEERVIENCYTCFGNKKVTCWGCNGSGKINCPNCKGTGKIIEYDELQVGFNFSEEVYIHNDSGLENAKFYDVSGQVLVEIQAKMISNYVTGISDLDEAINDLVRKCLQNSGGRHLLFQRLLIESVPVSQTVYFYKDPSKKGILWIYGEEQEIHVKKAPFDWRRIGLIYTTITIIVMMILFAYIYRPSLNAFNPFATSTEVVIFPTSTRVVPVANISSTLISPSPSPLPTITPPRGRGVEG